MPQAVRTGPADPRPKPGQAAIAACMCPGKSTSGTTVTCRVDEPQHVGDGQKVAGHVEQHAAPGEPGRVLDPPDGPGQQARNKLVNGSSLTLASI